MKVYENKATIEVKFHSGVADTMTEEEIRRRATEFASDPRAVVSLLSQLNCECKDHWNVLSLELTYARTEPDPEDELPVIEQAAPEPATQAAVVYEAPLTADGKKVLH